MEQIERTYIYICLTAIFHITFGGTLHSDASSFLAAVKPDKPEIRGLGREGEPAPVAIPRIKLVLLGDSVRSQLVVLFAQIKLK